MKKKIKAIETGQEGCKMHHKVKTPIKEERKGTIRSRDSTY